MPNQREPTALLLLKGRKHLGAEEAAARLAREPQAPADDIRAPDYLSAKQKSEFYELARQLAEIKIFGNVDAGELGRYVTAHSMYARYTKLLRTLPKKKRARLRELRARLAEEEGRRLSPDEAVDDEDAALELERALTVLQDKYFNQCEQTAKALGLNISSRCRLVIPTPPPTQKENKFSHFQKGGEAGAV